MHILRFIYFTEAFFEGTSDIVKTLHAFVRVYIVVIYKNYKTSLRESLNRTDTPPSMENSIRTVACNYTWFELIA